MTGVIPNSPIAPSRDDTSPGDHWHNRTRPDGTEPPKVIPSLRMERAHLRYQYERARSRLSALSGQTREVVAEADEALRKLDHIEKLDLVRCERCSEPVFKDEPDYRRALNGLPCDFCENASNGSVSK